jgi:tetratricopeptide (TPR) repeat protein
VKDQRQYELAYSYANNTVRVAKSLEDGELLAVTKYVRACVKLEWAQFGIVKQRILQIDEEKIKDALHDFRDVLNIANSRYVSLHPQLRGFTMLQFGRAQSLLLAYGQYEPDDISPIALADRAENMVGRDFVDDAYTRMLTTGTLSGLHLGGYLLAKADILTTMGQPYQAIAELNQFKDLTEQSYERDETRNYAWSDIVTAKTLLELEKYPEATDKAMSAFSVCSTIGSAQNIVVVVDIHSRLAMSSYGLSAAVQELGGMLQRWLGEP